MTLIVFCLIIKQISLKIPELSLELYFSDNDIVIETVPLKIM